MSEIMKDGELRFVIEHLSANLLEVDPAVQRDISQARVKKIANNFAEQSLGVLVVSRRGGVTSEPRYVVLDGQTRLEVIRQVAGTAETTMPVLCQVYLNLSRREEAEIFLTHNDRAAVRKLDGFRISLVAQEQWAVEINAVADRYGYHVNRDKDPGHRFLAVGVAERLYRGERGLDVLDRTFDTINRAWNHTPNAASAEAVIGLGLLYQRHPGDIDFKGLASRLAKAGSPQQFMGVVAQHRHALGITMPEAAYRYAVQLHDKGRKSRRLSG